LPIFSSHVRQLIEMNGVVLNTPRLREMFMTTWNIAYSVESTGHTGTLTVENDGMSEPTARRYVADHLLRKGVIAPDAFDEGDIAVSYEPDIE
jgi:hypothetical protein